MESRMGFDSLLALVKSNYRVLIGMQPGLESRDLSDSQLHEIYLAAVNANPNAIELVPDSRWDEEILIAMIMHKDNKQDIELIARAFITKENGSYNILVALARKDFRVLIDISRNWEHVSTQFNLTEQQTYATLCLDVLKDNWRAMRFYPGTLIEDNIVMQATQKCKIDISQNWRDIVFVPDYLLEDKFFQPSVLKAQQAIMSGELEVTPFTSLKILTEEVCLAAIARDVYNFRKLPCILQTKNVCHETIKVAVHMLWDLEKPEDRLGLTPDEFKDLCIEAIKIHGAEAWRYIPRDMLAYNFYVKALNHGIGVLKFLKDNFDKSGLTPSEYDNLLELASNKYGIEEVVKYISPEMRTKSWWIVAVTANVNELYHLRESNEKTKLTKDDYKDIYLAAIAEHGQSALHLIAPEKWNYELCLAAVNKDVDALHDVTTNQKQTLLKPGEYATIFSIAKDKYGIEKTFIHFPPPMRTYDLCLEAVKKYPSALHLLQKPEGREGLKPGEYNKICLEAIELYGYQALYYITPEMRTYELCLAAIKKNNAVGLALLSKPEDRKGLKPGEYNNLCLEAIEISGFSALLSIAPEMRSYEICLAAVNKSVYSLHVLNKLQERPSITADQYTAIISIAKSNYGIQDTFRQLSPEARTFDICLEAVNTNVHFLAWLEKPEDCEGLKSGEYNTLCLETLKTHGLQIFKYISPEKWTYDLCVAAVTKDLGWLDELQKNKDKIKLTPDEYTKIYLEANKIHGSFALRFYPPEMQTFDRYLDAVNNDASVLRYLKDPKDRKGFKSGEYHKLCLLAIKKHGPDTCGYIDPDMLTYDLFLTAINVNVGALRYIREHKKKLTENEYFALCKLAKDKYGIKATFGYLPPEMKTYDVCLAAFNDDVYVLTHLKTANDRKMLTSKEYSDLSLMLIKKIYVGIIDLSLSDDILRSFIDRYESINILNDFKMENIGNFFSHNTTVISKIYSLLGKQTFLLMEKMLITSADNLSRFLSELKSLDEQRFTSCSKNIARLFDNVDYKNASMKASQLQLYLYLSSEEKTEINVLLDDNKIDIDIIPNAEIIFRRYTISRFASTQCNEQKQ